MAIREDEIAASSAGVNLTRTKVFAFVLSAVYGGLAGALYAQFSNYISPDTFSFDQSIVLFSMILIGGSGTLLGPVVGGALLTFFLPEWLRFIKEYYMAIYGLGIFFFAVLFMPRGIVPMLQTWRDKKRRGPFETKKGENGIVFERGGGYMNLLETRSITMKFGGLTAVGDVSMKIEEGRLHALIGPNGAGKSTLINVISGFYRATSGSLIFENQEVQGRGSAELSQLGISRTFQNLRLFRDLTVMENVLIGLHNQINDSFLACLFRTSGHRSAQKKQAQEAAEQMLQEVGLWEFRDRPARTLPYGKQKMA